MTPHRRAFLTNALPAAFWGAQSVEGPEKSVRDLLDRQIRDWNRGDLDGFMATYWNSPSLVFQSGGTRSEGWANVRERYRKTYQADGKEMGQLRFDRVEIQALAPEVSLARGRWELKMRDGSTSGGLFTLIVKKLPDGWKIIHDHTSADPKG